MYLPYPGLSHEAGPPGNPEQFEYKKNNTIIRGVKSS